MSGHERFRDEGFTQAIDQAIAGDRAPLYDKFRRVCGLPGPRVNEGIVQAFAHEAARRGRSIDGLLAAMGATHETVAPYGHVDEIFPIVAAAATGMRAASDEKSRKKLLEALEEFVCDVRFRVRDYAAWGLGEMSIALGPDALPILTQWVEDDQPYLGRAVASMLQRSDVLSALTEEGSTTLLEALFQRFMREHRAGRRHTAFRELARALEKTSSVLVLRFVGAQRVLLDVAKLEGEKADIEARAVLQETVKNLRRQRPDLAELLLSTLEASEPAPRNPRHNRLPGKRGRGR